MTITPQELVNREVHYCVSYLVSTLAAGYGHVNGGYAQLGHGETLFELVDQAQELAAPIEDWEDAAIQAGWVRNGTHWELTDNGEFMYEVTAEDACRRLDEMAEPYQREVFEHWLVSEGFADKLAEKGEKVDKDFAGMTVWARTTTGQAIYADGVVKAICAELNTAAVA